MTIAIEKEVKHAKTVGTKLTPREYDEIAKMIDMGIFLSVSDFLRESVRDKLKTTKVIKLRDTNYEDAKKEVLGYYKNYNESYDYEVAENLELDYDLVCKITEELEQEGRLSGINE
jgi:Arc/MetJ-type ribon-helix-helix transcriptional regulator